MVTNKVNRNSSSSEPSTSSNPVNIILFLGRKLKIHNKSDLMNIYSSGQQIGTDKNSGDTVSELLHNLISFLHRHSSVDITHHEVTALHIFCEFLALFFSIHVNETLINIDVPENLNKVFKFMSVRGTTDVVLLNSF